MAVSGQDSGITGTAAGGGGTGDDDTIEVVSQPGSEPGLYGGTQDQSTCDREQLVTFLAANEDKAQAWAGAQGIEVDAIEDFVRSLTPLRLRFDTRVTNHGFSGGRATAYQTVLQAGTAVLVDPSGVPRVRCACGNPLLEPEPTTTAPTFTGTPWSGFSPGNITLVTVVQDIDIFVVTTITDDASTDTTFNRPAGTDGSDDSPGSDGSTPTVPPFTVPPGTTPPDTSPPDTSGPTLGTGDVQVTLRWSGDSDLDLHVIDPDGFEISFSATTSPSGGQLDVDCIPSSGCADSGQHVENVFWPVGGRAVGRVLGLRPQPG